MSNTKREEFQTVKNRITEIDEKIQNLKEKQQPLFKREKELVADIIVEEEILQRSKWKVKISPDQVVYLSLIGHWRSEAKALTDLIWSDFHCNFFFPKEHKYSLLEISYEDNELLLYQNGHGHILEVADELGLDYVIDDVQDQINRYRKKADRLKQAIKYSN